MGRHSCRLTVVAGETTACFAVWPNPEDADYPSATATSGGNIMTVCRTLEEVIAAADADSAAVPPLTQAQADQVAAILAPHWPGAVAAAS
jgi:hypothetical protein